jgi:hypothetical protein
MKKEEDESRRLRVSMRVLAAKRHLSPNPLLRLCPVRQYPSHYKPYHFDLYLRKKPLFIDLAVSSRDCHSGNKWKELKELKELFLCRAVRVIKYK